MLDTSLSAGGESDPAELARGVAQRLRKLERQLQFRGAAIADDQLESQVETLARAFIAQKLPHWRALGIL